MKKWKLYTIVVTVVAFVGCNLFLLYKEDSKAQRTVYVTNWSEVKNDKVKKTFKTEGVVKPEEEYYYYYDKEQGPIASFEVKEGDIVSAGTALYTYGSKALNEEKATIEAEITQIESEMASLDSQLSDLERIDSRPSTNNSSTSEADKNIKVDVNVTNVINGDVEKAMADVKAEQGKLEAKLARTEDHLTRILEKLDDVTITSDVEGQVIAINKDMQDPIVTIASSVVAVEGVLTEKQMKQAEESQKVTMYSSLYDKKYNGTIQQIVSYPKGKVDLKKEAVYPFTIQMEKPDEKLIPGNRLDLTVVVDEVEDVPVVTRASTFKEGKKINVYQLTQKGTVEQKKILSGLSFNGKQEVKKGLEVGNIIVTNPSEVDAVNAPFITPMKTSHVEKNEWKQLSKKKVAKYLLIGLLEK